MMTPPLLTFIVPVYNVEKYVGQCITSLVNQSVINHKVIIVNDGSTDSSGEICKNLVNKNPDLITYIEKENGGLGSARNVGMKMVETPYLTFLDSDDWANSLFVENFQSLIKNNTNELDLIFSEPMFFDSVTKKVFPFKDQDILYKVFQNNEITNSKATPELYDLEVAAWRKIYRTDFLKKMNFSFSKGKWEDVRPHFQILHTAKNCATLKNCGFFYRINTGGQITADTGKGRLDLIPVFQETLNMAQKENFTRVEIRHILRLFIIFTKWFIDVTDNENILPLLIGLHNVYKSISNTYLKDFFLTSSKTDKCLLLVLRSPFFRILRNREKSKSIFLKLKSLKGALTK